MCDKNIGVTCATLQLYDANYRCLLRLILLLANKERTVGKTSIFPRWSPCPWSPHTSDMPVHFQWIVIVSHCSMYLQVPWNVEVTQLDWIPGWIFCQIIGYFENSALCVNTAIPMWKKHHADRVLLNYWMTNWRLVEIFSCSVSLSAWKNSLDPILNSRHSYTFAKYNIPPEICVWCLAWILAVLCENDMSFCVCYQNISEWKSGPIL